MNEFEKKLLAELHNIAKSIDIIASRFDKDFKVMIKQKKKLTFQQKTKFS